jgi:hypothetical protein
MLVIRDIRLRFYEWLASQSPFLATDNTFITNAPLNSSYGWVIQDHCHWGNAAATVASHGGATYVRVVSNGEDEDQWATWTLVSGAGGVSYSKPGIVGDGDTLYVYLHDGSNITRRASTDGVTWGSPTTICAWPPAGYASQVGIAPVSGTEVYLCGVSSASPYKLDVWRYINTTGTKWPNTIYGATLGKNCQTYFDAVKHPSGKRLVFFQSRDSGLTMVASVQDGMWSMPRPIVPIDIVDDTSHFKIYSAEVVQGITWLVGRYTRYGSTQTTSVAWDMMIRSYDGEFWTLDRHCFVAAEEMRSKILKVGDFVYYPGARTIYRGKSSWLIDPAGGGNPSLSAVIPAGELHRLSWQDAPADGSAGSFGAGVIASGNVLYWPVTPSSSWAWDDGHEWP